MSIQALQNKLDHIVKNILYDKSTADNAFRLLMGKELHIFTIRKGKLVADLLAHKDTTEDKEPVFNKEDKALIQSFVALLIKGIKAGVESKQKGWNFIKKPTAATLIIGVEAGPGTANAYKAIKALQNTTANKLIDSDTPSGIKDLFGKSTQFMKESSSGNIIGFGNLANVGHVAGVTGAKGVAFMNVLGQDQSDLGAYKDPDAEGQIDVDAMNKLSNELQSDFMNFVTDEKTGGTLEADLELWLTHYKDISIEKGALTGITQVETNAQGAFQNQVEQANMGMLSESEIARRIKKAIKVVQDKLQNEFDIKTDINQKTSPSFKELLIGMLVGKRLRRVATRVPPHILKDPKSIKPISTQPRGKSYKKVRKNYGDVSSIGATKSATQSMQGGKSGRPSSGPSQIGALPALINAQLGRTVLGNMGAPALENRSGTFAASARIAGARSVRGQLQLEYTYAKNPYEVFEMGGRGRQPWATDGRDPRNIIEKSIREIAAEQALGAFTTRRI